MTAARINFSLIALMAILSIGISSCEESGVTGYTTTDASSKRVQPDTYTYRTLSNPTRIEVMKNRVWVATFTEGSYTVILSGPSRTFSETVTIDNKLYDASVAHSTWVRTLPAPFADSVDLKWLKDALSANNLERPDILSIAMDYIDGASDIYANNLRIAGDADYGPLDPNDSTKRLEGSDFNDYLGLAWNYSYDNYTDNAESDQIGSLDCSGFMRMIWGYRHSMSGYRYSDRVPLKHETTSSFVGMPRKSYEIFEDGVGTVIIANSGSQATNFAGLQIGDLVFFDADTSGTDGSRIDHVGMYIGIDDDGYRRFISSRKKINGPTMGDYAGVSLLDRYFTKNGVTTPSTYTKAFRAARRL